MITNFLLIMAFVLHCYSARAVTIGGGWYPSIPVINVHSGHGLNEFYVISNKVNACGTGTYKFSVPADLNNTRLNRNYATVLSAMVLGKSISVFSPAGECIGGVQVFDAVMFPG